MKPSRCAFPLYRLVLAVSGVLSLALAAPSARAAAAGFLYALTEDKVPKGSTINAFAVNESTGALTLVPGSPFAAGGNGSGLAAGERLAVDRANKRLYAINDGSDTLSAFSIDPGSGALTALPFSPIALGAGVWVTVAVHPSGSPVVVGDNNGNTLASFVITPTSSTAAAGSPFPAVTVLSAAFSQNGAFIYTGGQSGELINGFSVNATTGVLNALANSPFATGSSIPNAYATDAAGRMFMSCPNPNFDNPAFSSVRVFTTTAGIPAPAGGCISGLSQGFHSTLHPNGFYLVADQVAVSQIGVYQVTGSGAATTLTAVAGSPFATGGNSTQSIALNQLGTFVYAANAFSRNLSILSLNPATGVLGAPTLQAPDTLGTSGKTNGLAYISMVNSDVDLNVKIAGPAGVIVAGSGAGNAVFTITVKNNGPADASGVKIANTQKFPTGVTIVSEMPSAGTFTPATGVWALGNLAAGAAETLTIIDTVGPDAAVGPGVIAVTSSVIGADENLINPADDTATAIASVTFSVASGPTAEPNPAGVGQAVTFWAATSGTGMIFSLSFGDGSSSSASLAKGTGVTHVYAAPGTYTVNMMIASFGGLKTGNVQVVVNAPVVGTGYDSDGDGFSDDFEKAVGTDPNSAVSTPTGQGITAAGIKPLNVTKPSIKLRFTGGAGGLGKDGIFFSGKLDFGAGFIAGSRKILIDVGGVTKTLSLNAKGSATSGGDSFSRPFKSTTGKYSAALTKGAFAAVLADKGLNGATDVTGKPVTVVFTLVANNLVLQKAQAMSFTAKKGYGQATAR